MDSIINDIISLVILGGFALFVTAGFMKISITELLTKIKEWWNGEEND